MSTRGFVGMVRDGRTLTTYVHYDAMPENLGMKTILFARANLRWIDLVAEQFFALTTVNRGEDPTPEQLAQLKERLGGRAVPQPAGVFDEMALERAFLDFLGADMPEDSSASKELKTWPDLQDLAHGDLGVFLKAGFLPVLFDGPGTDEAGSVDAEWGYLINLDNRYVDVYSVATDESIHIPFDDLALMDAEELLQLPSTIKSELEEEEED